MAGQTKTGNYNSHKELGKCLTKDAQVVCRKFLTVSVPGNQWDHLTATA